MANQRRPVSKTKARKILSDKKVRGKPLTERQRKFFGAIASGQPPKRKRKK